MNSHRLEYRRGNVLTIFQKSLLKNKKKKSLSTLAGGKDRKQNVTTDRVQQKFQQYCQFWKWPALCAVQNQISLVKENVAGPTVN